MILSQFDPTKTAIINPKDVVANLPDFPKQSSLVLPELLLQEF